MELSAIDTMVKAVTKKAMRDLEVNDIPLAEFLAKVDDVADFLKSEIMLCEEILSDTPVPYYNGLDVGHTNSQELRIDHIQFCKKLLKMMNFEEEKTAAESISDLEWGTEEYRKHWIGVQDSLKRCPFCGGEAFYQHRGALSYTVSCDSCDAELTAATEDFMVEQWNRRT